MYLAFSSRAFRDYSLTAAIHILGQIGYRGIEIMADIPHAFPPEMDSDAISRVKSALAQNNMGIANINTSTLFAHGDAEHPNWIEDNEVQRSRRIQHTIDALYLGEQLGACSVSTFAGGILGAISREDATSRFLDGLNQVLPHCESAGVALLIEPKPYTLVERVGQFLALWDQYESPWLGLDLEVGHLYIAHENPIAEMANLKSFVWHVAMEDVPESLEHQHLPPGEGIVDFPGILRSLAGMNYTGYVTLELRGEAPDVEEMASKALDYLRRVIPADVLNTRPLAQIHP